MTLRQGAELMALARELDDPEQLESPSGGNGAVEQRRFRELVAELSRRFGAEVSWEAGLRVQDASFLGHLSVAGIFVRVSNFGRMALVGVSSPGVHGDAETVTLLGAALPRLVEALEGLGYVPVLGEALEVPYDGASGHLRTYRPPEYPFTWFERFFDYL